MFKICCSICVSPSFTGATPFLQKTSKSILNGPSIAIFIQMSSLAGRSLVWVLDLIKFCGLKPLSTSTAEIQAHIDICENTYTFLTPSEPLSKQI